LPVQVGTMGGGGRMPMPNNKVGGGRPKVGAPSEQGGEQQINDYSQNFVDTGLRPQNYLRDAVLTDRWGASGVPGEAPYGAQGIYFWA